MYALLGLLMLFVAGPSSAYEEPKGQITAYGAQLSADSMGDTLGLRANMTNSYVAVIAGSLEIFSVDPWGEIELEIQLGQHFGVQDHLEVNGTTVFRWNRFPFEDFVDLSAAIGFGLSYAFETPEIEADGVESTPQFLGYVLGELGIALPSHPQWVLIGRLHHRSGANGTFGDRHDASNGLGVGLAYQY